MKRSRVAQTLPIPSTPAETARQIKFTLARFPSLRKPIELAIPGFMFACLCCAVRDSEGADPIARELCGSLVEPLRQVQVAPFQAFAKGASNGVISDALRAACDAGVYAMFGDERGAEAEAMFLAAVYWLEEAVAQGIFIIDEEREMARVMQAIKQYLADDWEAVGAYSEAAYDIAGRITERFAALGIYW
jgi:hypothetical protein